MRDHRSANRSARVPRAVREHPCSHLYLRPPTGSGYCRLHVVTRRIIAYICFQSQTRRFHVGQLGVILFVLAMKREKISELTTNRLSVYLRCLDELASAGIKTVSSQELAEQFNLNS